MIRNKSALLFSLAAAVGVGSLLARPQAARAQTRSLNQANLLQALALRPTSLGGLGRTQVKQLLLTDLEGTHVDHDGNGILSLGDTLAGNGKVWMDSSEVGYWQFAATVAGSSGVSTGLLYLRFADGTLTLAINPASENGTKSRVASIAVLGGTGKYAAASGNAGFFATSSGIHIQLGVK